MYIYSFVANSSWYLFNFRISTLRRFSEVGKVNCFKPKEVSKSYFSKEKISTVDFSLDPTSTSLVKEVFSFLSLLVRVCFSRTDILFSFNPKTNLYSLVVCWILRIPCIPNVSGVGVASQLSGKVGKLYHMLAKFFYRRATYVFFQNINDYNEFIKLGWISPERGEVLPGSGVDLQRFRPYSKSRPVSFLMASRLIKQKGVMEYLYSSNKIIQSGGSANFILAGVEDDSTRAVALSDIKTYCKNGCINFVGRIDDMPSLLKEVDVVVLPSYYPEGTPRSLLEAAAAGKVIITTDTPGCRDVVIEGVNGFLVPPRDTEALKEAMKKVINLSDEKLAEMQVNSRKLAEEKFDEEYVIQRYLDVAEEILAKKSKK